MYNLTVSLWKKAPFVKLLIPFIAGIIIQWYFQRSPIIWQFIFASSFILFISFFFLPFFSRYKLAVLNGLFVTIIFAAAGAILLSQNDIRNSSKWFEKFIQNKPSFVVTLGENPVEKAKSYKATAEVNYVIENRQEHTAAGKIILYFAKDSSSKQLHEGTKLIFNNSLQEIKNSGNPGSFDYKRYCLFQQITHQSYLKQGEFVVLNKENESLISKLINGIRQKVLTIISTYIPGEKEKGLAEALLIGYKDDLDKTLVQSYSNTGVVHIIAISGMHLGLIYWLLGLLCKPLLRKKYTKWLSPVLIIAGLWLFSLIAGAQPSILRSAVMFTCIVLGRSIGKKSSIYNSLAVSAFILLCYNPYWLWDAGFQLSYSAVLSIVIFMRPVYNWLYVKNKILDFIWKMNAVTIAAQVLTIPITIYHFHQFPNLFLLTNFIAVPLSSLVVLGEILLCGIFFIPPLAFLIGKILYGLIWFMNTWIERIEILPFSLWDGLQINIVQAILLMLAISMICFWLLEKKKNGLIAGMIALLAFITIRSISFIKAQNQQKIIVYNVPRQQAIDFVNGRNFQFVGDTALENDVFARNFNLKPSRIMNRVSKVDRIDDFKPGEEYFSFNNTHVLMINKSVSFKKSVDKQTIDLLIISKNPKLNIPELADNFIINQVVFDGSVPAWKSKYWKKDCDSLHIHNYDVSEKGAFVMNLR